jgi:glycyl-tRNA synthetase beta chain
VNQDFLLELRSEEIPARMQDKARDDLARLFAAELDKAGLKASEIITYATPRRLALIAKGLPLETEAVREEIKGPKTSAPPQALEGFLRKTGLTQDQLVDRDGVYFAVIEKPGRATSDVLAEAIPAIIRTFPWPKSQRWGAASASTESLRWVRPLQGIVALLGDDVVACAVDGIVSGSATMGHRFHHHGEITIGNAGDYVAKLMACHVIVDQEARRHIIRTGAEKVASDAGLVLVPDEGLVSENAGLTEWPVPMIGRFDPAFLSVPEEVIQLTARVNQKYFVCKNPPRNGEVARSDGGVGPGSVKSSTVPSASTGPSTASGSPPRSGEDFQLANAFVCTANIVAHDGGAAIVAGNEKVLAARLSDAKFFWEQDLKVPLDVQREKLSSIVFHEKLGTVADKVERVAKLARWLVTSGVIPAQAGTQSLHEQGGEASKDLARLGPGLRRDDEEVETLAQLAERAARLCKADLVTGMVGEFPELQGIMGGYYARAQGESDAVADAIRDHYKPVGQGDDVPTAPVTVAVSLADKLDTLAVFFAIDEMPTGSKDPFALRRAALGILALIQENSLRLNLSESATEATSLVLRQAADENRAFTYDGDEPTDQLITSHPESYKVDWLARDWFVMFGRSRDPYHGSDDEMAFLGHDGSPYSWKRYDALNRQFSDFFADRLKVQQREAGVRHDLIDAVFALGGEDDLVRLLARVKALQAFVETGDGVNLLAGYKRAANILKSSPERGGGGVADGGAGLGGGHSLTVPSTSTDPSTASGSPPRSGEDLVEAALREALNAAEPKATTAIKAENFEAAMTALASLRAPIDAFFEGVMVNDPDPDKRAYRLGLLTRFRDAVHRVADFSKIEG